MAGFASDVAHLRPIAQKIAMIGPGRIHDAHSDHERVAIADLLKAKEIYVQLCRDFLQQDSHTKQSIEPKKIQE